MGNQFLWRLRGWQLWSLKLFNLSIEQFGATKLISYRKASYFQGLLLTIHINSFSHFCYVIRHTSHGTVLFKYTPLLWGCLPVGKQARVAKLMPGELLIWDWRWVQTNCNPRSVSVNVCLGLQPFTWIVTFLATGFSAMNALFEWNALFERNDLRFLWSTVISVSYRGFLQLSF